MDFPGRILPGQTDQLITAYSATQKFEIGTRRIEYGRTFRYAKAGETFVSADGARLVKNGNFEPEWGSYQDTYGFYGDLLTAAAAGAKHLDLEEAAGRVANFFQGAYVTTFADIAGVRNFTTFYVVKSDASEATFTRIYLDHPVVTPISATNGIHLYNSPYSRVIDGQSEMRWAPCIGRVLCGDVPINNFFWLQTAGPCWVTPFEWNSANTPGYNASSLDVYAWIDGTIASVTKCPPTTGYQRVGYLLPAHEQGTGAAGGCVFIMLQLE